MRDDNNRVIPINWNEAPEFELSIFNRLTSNFWLPEKVPLSNDLKSWDTLSEDEKTLVMRVFAGLTLLDTIQGSVGAVSLLADAKNAFEEAIICNIIFMEQVHAKSYSSIFTTLSDTRTINEAFRWSEHNEHLQYKADRVVEAYDGGDEQKKKIASVFLESGLFYSGFALPFIFASRGKLTNTADIISLIVRDEAMHGFALGAWFQRNLAEETPERQQELKEYAYDLAADLYDNEEAYTRSLYDTTGLTDTVIPFVKYNFNKALQNLGYDPLFSKNQTEVSAAILSALSPDSNENHDFFSGSGSAYVMGTAEETQDEDWDF